MMASQNGAHWSFLAGRLALDWIPYQNPIIMGAFVFAVLVGAGIATPVLYYGKVGYFWREWLTSVDHKKIGVMYIAVGVVMLFRGFIDAMMLRTQQFMAAGPHSAGFLGAAHGYLPPFHFDQIYSSHGTIMIFFAATPILLGLQNLIVPLQLGARDMAYPFLNALGLMLTTVGAALVMASLFVGDFSHAGWVGLTPLTELPNSPGVGVDYWLWSIQLSGIGTTIGAINLIATIVKMRAPGMTWFRIPMFSWVSLSTNIIALTIFPVLTIAIALLTLDRYLGTHFFTAGAGGDFMLYTNLFWVWGHPEVYFLALPAFGIMSEIIPNFSRKTLYGYITMVAASFAIAGISWSVWLHHFFIMGQGPGVNAFFSLATMMVGIPTGVKVFNWIFTIFRGRVHFDSPMMWALGALFLLPIGGMTGMMLANSPVNYQVHNSVFVVAHFHNMIMLIVFAILGAVSYWFPKVFGFKLDERLGKRIFWLWVVASIGVFVPMYLLGFAGLTRRMDYIPRAAMSPLLAAEEAGIFVYCIAAYYQLKQLYVSFRDRRQLRAGNDPWEGGRSLEWATHSPVPFYNFAKTPLVHARDEWDWRKEHGLTQLAPERSEDYEDIVLPKNTAVSPLIGVLTFVFGFAMVWRIYWAAIAAGLGIVAALIFRAFQEDTHYTIPAREVERMENDIKAREAEPETSGVGAYAWSIIAPTDVGTP